MSKPVMDAELGENLHTAFQTLATNAPTKEALAISVETLAHGSRQDITIRQRLSEPQHLQNLVKIVQSSILESPTITDHALRCIANACADNDAARGVVTATTFQWASQCFQSGNDDLRFLTVKVLYNICLDYEPAQQQCFRDKIHFELLRFRDASEPYDNTPLYDLLLWITGHKSAIEPQLNESPNADELALLLPDLDTYDGDGDQFAVLIEVVLTYLRDPIVQTRAVQGRLVNKVSDIAWAWKRIAARTIDNEESDDEMFKLLLPLGTSFTWVMSDLAAHEGFAKTYHLDDELIRTYLEFAKHPRFVNRDRSHPNHESAKNIMSGLNELEGIMLNMAYQVVGNQLWGLEPEKYSHLVERDQFDRSVYASILKSSEAAGAAAGVMHSAAGLLIQLSRPSVHVREMMGAADDALAALERLCRHDTAEVKQAGIKLLRALGKDCPVNQERFAALAKEALQSAQTGDAREVEEVL